jgi:guanidinobutyrase
LSSREMIAIVRAIAGSRLLIGCDLSELSPPWDISGMTAKLAARLFLEVIASQTLSAAKGQWSPLAK